MNRVKIVLLVGFLNVSPFAHELYVGSRMVNFDYEEKDGNGNFLDGETSDFSDISGIEIALRFDTTSASLNTMGSYLKLLFFYARGSSKYEGFLSNQSIDNIHYSGTTDAQIYTGELRVAAEKIRDDHTFSAFAGAGYRHWQRDLDNHEGYGYEEAYKWPYILIGIGAKWSIDAAWSIGTSFYYQHAIDPKLDASLDGKITLDLGTTEGFHLDIPLTWNFSRRFFIEGNYAYDYWNIDESNVAYGSSGQAYIEPRSATKNQIISLRIGYGF
ncbi:hypothetical protein [Hydrogenimonas sp.]